MSRMPEQVASLRHTTSLTGAISVPSTLSPGSDATKAIGPQLQSRCSTVASCLTKQGNKPLQMARHQLIYWQASPHAWSQHESSQWELTCEIVSPQQAMCFQHWLCTVKNVVIGHHLPAQSLDAKHIDKQCGVVGIHSHSMIPDDVEAAPHNLTNVNACDRGNSSEGVAVALKTLSAIIGLNLSLPTFLSYLCGTLCSISGTDTPCLA